MLIVRVYHVGSFMKQPECESLQAIKDEILGVGDSEGEEDDGEEGDEDASESEDEEQEQQKMQIQVCCTPAAATALLYVRPLALCSAVPALPNS